MTTVLDNIMTLLQYAPATNDDQQVPDAQSVVAPAKNSIGSSAKTKKPHIPDFGSLLFDAQNNNTALNTPELIQSIAYPDTQTTHAAGDDFTASLFMEKGDSELDELSLYDGFSLDPLKKPKEEEDLNNVVVTVVAEQGMKPEDTSILASCTEVVRPSTLPLQASSQALPPTTTPDLAQYPTVTQQYDGISPVSTASSFDPNSPTSDPQLLSEIEMHQEKLEAVCKNLWITKDPFQWTQEQVQKWALYTLKDCYNIQMSHLPNFQMDGTNLCLLSEEDFVSRNPDVGKFLYAELTWWKTVVMSPKEEPVTYMDLSNSTSSSTSSSFFPSTTADIPLQSTAPMSTADLLNSISMTVASSTTSPTTVLAHSPQQHMTPLTSPSSSTATPAPYTLSVIPTPVLDDLEMTKSTLCQINNEVTQQQQQRHLQQQQQQQPPQYQSYLDQLQYDDGTGTPVTSCDSSMNSMDFTFAGIDIKKEEDEEFSEDEEESSPQSNGERRSYVSHSKHTIHLWQFLKNLLLSPEQYGSYIKWIDHSKGIFKIENSVQVAKLWGKRKNRPNMNYDKLSRSIRQYYKKGIIKKTSTSKRLVYQFQPTYL